jgi:hypothetical protein
VEDSRSLSNINIFLSGGLQLSVKYKYIPQWRTPDLCQIIMYSTVVDSSSLSNTNVLFLSRRLQLFAN